MNQPKQQRAIRRKLPWVEPSFIDEQFKILGFAAAETDLPLVAHATRVGTAQVF